MRGFFKHELQTLHAKTGIRQFENLMQEPNWKEKANELINLMVEECRRPPFDMVKDQVKERVIADAVLNDPDFIGFNVKFVRKALYAWWQIHGGRILEAINEKPTEVYNKKELSEEERKKIDEIANKYLAELRSCEGMQQTPKMERRAVEKLGAEWKSGIERKQIQHHNGLTPEKLELRQKLLRAGSEFYKGRSVSSFHLKAYEWEGVHFMADSDEDAMKIVDQALTNEV